MNDKNLTEHYTKAESKKDKLYTNMKIWMIQIWRTTQNENRKKRIYTDMKVMVHQAK